MATAKNVIVLLKFKSQPEKGDKTVLELTNLIEKVKEEPNFVSIKLHVDPKDPTNVLLYEEWEDASYYNNEHMNTEHIKSFMANSTNFLTGPPDITFWEVQRVFE
ncbi:putative quinol monooxygenase [[Muricauda] lutisoli]|uniref:Antibiotic biosynthesis monooxygenase n=1 Tax=[Muricauda] lutisoli TaxID=2816035 RepID=A0ABS3EU37_9FLAO|nr:putative quinol monooxygenase [[Muricauda] lutisoli]MBO0329262.1 antibiotic biosynthesis monooxygenase [[Muricauda] lutisoli]